MHAVQFHLFGALRDAGLLPVTRVRLGAARGHLDVVLEKVAADYADELAPAIERVWRDGVESVRADLREWLRRASEDDSGFVPWRFELSFGLPSDRDACRWCDYRPVCGPYEERRVERKYQPDLAALHKLREAP